MSNTGYFVFANRLKGDRVFDGKLVFELSILPYEASDIWVEPTIVKIKEVLESDILPTQTLVCEFCEYRNQHSIAES